MDCLVSLTSIAAFGKMAIMIQESTIGMNRVLIRVRFGIVVPEGWSSGREVCTMSWNSDILQERSVRILCHCFRTEKCLVVKIVTRMDSDRDGGVEAISKDAGFRAAPR